MVDVLCEGGVIEVCWVKFVCYYVILVFFGDYFSLWLLLLEVVCVVIGKVCVVFFKWLLD